MGNCHSEKPICKLSQDTYSFEKDSVKLIRRKLSYHDEQNIFQFFKGKCEVKLTIEYIFIKPKVISEENLLKIIECIEIEKLIGDEPV